MPMHHAGPLAVTVDGNFIELTAEHGVTVAEWNHDIEPDEYDLATPYRLRDAWNACQNLNDLTCIDDMIEVCRAIYNGTPGEKLSVGVIQKAFSAYEKAFSPSKPAPQRSY